MVKKSACQCRRYRRHGFYPWTGKIPWNRKWQPTPVFLPGKSHRQPKGHRRLRHDLATKWLNNSNSNCIGYFQGVIKESIGRLKMLNICGLVTYYVYSKSEYGKLRWGRKDGWGWGGEEERTMKYYHLRKGKKTELQRNRLSFTKASFNCICILRHFWSSAILWSAK